MSTAEAPNTGREAGNEHEPDWMHDPEHDDFWNKRRNEHAVEMQQHRADQHQRENTAAIRDIEETMPERIAENYGNSIDRLEAKIEDLRMQIRDADYIVRSELRDDVPTERKEEWQEEQQRCKELLVTLNEKLQAHKEARRLVGGIIYAWQKRIGDCITNVLNPISPPYMQGADRRREEPDYPKDQDK